MPVTTHLGKAGRIVIPKSLRDDLHLEVGDEIAFDRQGDSITIKAVPSEPRMGKEHGIWVFYGTGAITAAEARAFLEQDRDERDRHVAGEDE